MADTLPITPGIIPEMPVGGAGIDFITIILSLPIFPARSWDAVILKYIQYPPGDFLLTTNASIPHLDDKFILTWNPSERAKSYSVYKYDKYITSINDSVILLKDNIVENNYLVSNLTRGDWFFTVVAFNPLGNISSDCINISIVLPLDIIINDPISDELFGNTPPNFNITIIGEI
ncbi:unnamed protein product [marine sediment metagenome]|uniref:Fibronectin type-III domain-containing protein n=1 Tax=marine sediment metagenome TaxID=412755 RepID=X1BZJ0_9ZZZZ